MDISALHRTPHRDSAASRGRPAEADRSSYLTALARARRVHRRDLALVERYLSQIRQLASAQAKGGAGERRTRLRS
jgi:hypothetical protein